MSTDKQVVDAIRKKRIKQLAQSIRKKYLGLKLGKSEEDEALNKLFTPVTTPLKQLVQTTMTTEALKLPNITASSIKKEKIPKEPKKKTPETPTFLPVESVAETSYNSDDDVFQQPLLEPSSSSPTSFSQGVLEDYLEQYPVMSHPYITDFQKGSEKIDKIYGPIYDDLTSKWRLGTKELDFNLKTAGIKMDGMEFKGTPGLYQLIFYNEPHYNQEDIKQYKHLLEMSGVHRKANGALKFTGSMKYNKIIRPLFTGHQTPPSSRSRTWQGTGLDLVYNRSPIEYVYFDNVNELVERLKLLVASQEAGNNSHQNEIVAIVNELKEANIICER